MNGLIRYGLFVCLFTVVLDGISFYLLQHVPEDAVFNLGPTLGLMQEQRMIDLLVYKEFATYYGYPPLFFIIQALWYLSFGISEWSVYLFVMFIHVGIVLTFFYVFRYVLKPPMLVIVSLVFFSSVYFTSGRPDPVVVIFLLLLISNLLELNNELRKRNLIYSCLLLLVIFYIHPLAFVISSYVFFITLLVTYKAKAIKPLILTGLVVVCVILVTYLPFVLEDVPSWKGLFVTLAERQDHFNLSAFIKFCGLNMGTFLLLFAGIALLGRSIIVALLKNHFFWISLSSFLLISLWGMSYYYIYPFVFVVTAFVIVWGDQWHRYNEERRLVLLRVIFILCALVSLYQGSVGKIIQGIRNQEYGIALKSMRKVVSGFDFRTDPIYADYQLIPTLADRKEINLLWHGMKYFRREPPSGSFFIFPFENSWDSNKVLLGNWQDSTQYEIRFLSEKVRGLPALYSTHDRGSDVQLIIVCKK